MVAYPSVFSGQVAWVVVTLVTSAMSAYIFPMLEIFFGIHKDRLKPGISHQIIRVEGPKDHKVTAIHFKDDNMAERRIALKFVRLQVL